MPTVVVILHLQAQRNIPITIIIILLKHICHALERNARLHKEIKAQHALPPTLVPPAPSPLGISGKQQLDELRTEPVPKSHQGVLKLPQTDIAAPVHVEAIEEAPPRGQKAPEPAELVKVYLPATICVEHAYHHFYCVGVESCVVAVDEGAAQFTFGKLAAAVLVDLHEEGPEGVAVVAVAGGWRSGGWWALL